MGMLGGDKTSCASESTVAFSSDSTNASLSRNILRLNPLNGQSDLLSHTWRQQPHTNIANQLKRIGAPMNERFRENRDESPPLALPTALRSEIDQQETRVCLGSHFR